MNLQRQPSFPELNGPTSGEEYQAMLATLRASQYRQEFLLKLNDALGSIPDPVEIQDVAARILGEHLDADRTYYALVEGDYETAVVERDYVRSGASSMVGTHAFADFESAFATYRTGRVLVLDDVEDGLSVPANDLPGYRTLSIRSVLGVPLVKNGKTLAVMCVLKAIPHHWTRQEIALVEDTGERTWAAVERARAENALRQEDSRKDEFMAMLGHELRNPLAIIANTLLILEITRGTDASLPYDKAVGLMSRETRHLSRMVNDLLDVSRIRQGKIKLEQKRIDLGQLVQQTVEAARPIYQKHNQLLAFQRPSFPLYVHGDAIRLAQMVMNLLTNGTINTPDGGHVWVSLEALERSAVLRVKDDGIGIAPDQLKAIFGVFVQSHTSLDRPQGGLGLGLAMVKQLVEDHWGTIAALSDGAGQGSEFRIELPLLTGESTPTRAVTDKLQPVQASSSGRVLVVDDNKDLADMTAKLIQLRGYEVHVRYSGSEALAAAEALLPNAILLDIGMPYLDGYAVCQQIRKQPWGKSMPVIALTGYGQEADKQRSRAAGFDDHLLKPIDYPLLIEILTRYINP